MEFDVSVKDLTWKQYRIEAADEEGARHQVESMDEELLEELCPKLIHSEWCVEMVEHAPWPEEEASRDDPAGER